MCGVLIGLWVGYYVRLGRRLTGITGSVHCTVVPVLDCRSGGMFELAIVRMELGVMSSGLASEVTLCQSGFHIHVCSLECVQHMQTEGHCFLYIIYVRGASLLDPACLAYVCFIAGFACQFVYTILVFKFSPCINCKLFFFG